MESSVPPRLDWRAIFSGFGTGLALVLLLLLSYWLLPPLTPGPFAALGRALLIFVPAGFVTGLRTRSPRRPASSGLALSPPAVYALITGVLLAVVQALLLALTNANLMPGIGWFLMEVLLAAGLASVGGIFGGRARRRARE